ncbi:PTS transporter subunit EIIC [Streptococcaceae bacterium ESL0687]|nr:PTS transporter subunit EIIC [Streptococcaceae bacterium ESL0687]
MDYKKIAEKVLAEVGGKSNITSVTHCVTRLRLILKDNDKVDYDALESIEGVKGVIFNSGQVQIIFGAGAVNQAYDEFVKLTGVKEVSLSQMKDEGVSNSGNKLQQGFKIFSDIFIPIIPAFIGAAMILGLRSLITTPGIFGMEGTLADKSVFLNDLASFFGIIATTFDYLPVLIMYSATKRFGGNPILGLLVGFVMIHPGLANRNDLASGALTPDSWHLFGLSVPMVGFQGGVFPAILTSWFLAKVEKLTSKYSPQALSYILVPTLTIILANLALFLVFGPLGNFVGAVLGGIIDFLYMKMGVFGAFVFAAALQPLTVTGTQHAIQGIEANLIATTGFNYIQPIWSVSIIAQGGGCIGMYLLFKKKSKDREIALSSFVPTLVGITEPAIFAVNLKYSIVPFVCSFIGAGFGGVVMKIFDVKAIGQGLTVLPGLTIANPVLPYILGNLVAFTLPIIFILSYDKYKQFIPEGKHKKSKNKNTKNSLQANKARKAVV